MKLKRSCREVAHLVLEGEDRRLGPLERLSLHLHWRACVACSNFRDQTRAMRVALDHWRRYRDST